MNPRGQYQLQDFSYSHLTGVNGTPSSSTYSVPQSSLHSYSIPRKAVSRFSARSDEVSLIDDRRHVPESPALFGASGRGSWRQTGPFQLNIRSWVPEIVASVFAVISLLVIVVVLRVYDGRGLDNLKLPRYLTLNGLIAAIATFERVFLVVPVGSALSQEAWLWLVHNEQESLARSKLRDLSLSDAASRGAWGSLLVIPYSGRRLLTLFGAIIMVLSLAIGTFTQQLIIVSSFPIANTSSPLQPGSIPRTEYYDNWHGNPAEDAWGPNLNMKASIYNGFMTQNISAVAPTCPTGNCTFPLTPSIAVCGDCMATTNAVTSGNSTTLIYTTSLGTAFPMSNWSYSDEGTGFSVQFTYQNNSRNGNFTVAQFEMLGVSYGSLSDALTEIPDPAMNSSVCRLWMCVNVYNTTVENGIQQQEVVQSFNRLPSTTSSSGGDNWTFTMPDTYKEAYNVSAFALEALNTELATLASGSVRLDLSGYDPTSDIVEAIWSGSNNRTYQDTWISNVAMSMSNIARGDIPAPPLPAYAGTGYQLGITVNWWWLVLPVVLLVGAVLLLGAVMLRTARSRVGVWKGNPLAILLLEADPTLRQQLRDIGREVDGSGAVDQRLGSKKATLTQTELGSWVLKGA